MYYKLVRVCDSGKKISFNGNAGHQDAFSLEYQQGVKTVPVIPNSKLYLFKELSDARAYIKRMSSCDGIMEIWECEAENVEDNPFILYPMDNKEMKKFWKTFQKETYHKNPNEGTICFETESYCLIDVRGTCWCDSITLTKKVEILDV